MKKDSISLKTAKQLALKTQLLDGQTSPSQGKESVHKIIEKLGYVQIDTISVVKRTHHLTIWTRFSQYKETMLHDLQAKDRAVFEYWGHAMSYLPMTDYRYFLPRMQNFQNPTSPWAKMQFEKCESLLDPVLERIRKEGPLSSKSFSSPKKKGRTWWDWKPAKVALEMLFWRGDLMITERINFHKVYDLTERVLPASVNTMMPGKDEIGRFLVRRALNALGVASEKGILAFMQPGAARDSDLQVAGKEIIKKAIFDLMDKREVTSLSIENQKKNYYTLSKFIENDQNKELNQSQLYLLSPFDNLIIQRERIKTLFNFDYTLECYVPADKRKFGYFVLPILWGDQFVGRLDPKADRKEKILHIQNLMFENKFNPDDLFLDVFTQKCVAFAKLNQCHEIQIHQVSPSKLKSKLKSRLKKGSEQLKP